MSDCPSDIIPFPRILGNKDKLSQQETPGGRERSYQRGSIKPAKFVLFERDLMFYLIVPVQAIDFKAMFYCTDFLA